MNSSQIHTSTAPSEQTQPIWIADPNHLRQLLGILGLLLPILLVFFLYLASGHTENLPSFSHYYFTRVCPLFCMVIGTMGVFLIFYNYEDETGSKQDFIVSLISGLGALILVHFPTSNLSDTWRDPNYVTTVLNDLPLRDTIHYAAAGIFIGGLAYMCLFLFTKSNKEVHERTPQKKIRNAIYRISGILMIAAMAVMGAGELGWIPEDVYKAYKLTFWMEVVAIESFGIAWLIKGKTLFQDKENANKTTVHS